MSSNSKSCWQCLQNRSEPTASVAPTTASRWAVAAASSGVSLLLSLSPQPCPLAPYMQPEGGCEHVSVHAPSLSEPSCGSISLRGKARVLAKAPERSSPMFWSQTSPPSSHTGLLAALSMPGTPHFRALHLLLPLPAALFSPMCSWITPHVIQGSGLQVSSSKAF